MQTYTALAPIYDWVMRHVNYLRWADHVDSIFRRFGDDVARVGEIACGTGTMLGLLTERGYEVCGLDVSMPMLREARSKMRLEGVEHPIWCADMRSFSVRRPFDAMVCLYDSVNYLLTTEDLNQLLRNVHDALVPGGLFIFDISTERNSRYFFDDYHEQEQRGPQAYERWSKYNLGDRIHSNRFEIMDNRVAGRCDQEVHHQRIYRLAEINDVVEQGPMSMVACYDDFSFRTGSERSERVHFVTMRGAT